MAKKKISEPKTMPQRGQFWEDTRLDPVPTIEILAYVQQGKDKTYDVSIRVLDSHGNNTERKDVWPLAKFVEPGMRMVDDSRAEDEEPKQAPAFQIVPTKKGVKFVCPSPTCQDEHPMEDATTFEEFSDRFRKFKARHEDHAREGTLFA